MGEIVVWGVGTSRTLRAHWILHEAGVDYEVRPIQSRTGETQEETFRRLNPREKIPVLQTDEVVIAESAAIVSYVARRYGGGLGLIPRESSRDRALYDQWCFFVMTELDAHTLYILRRHEDLSELYGEASAAVEAARVYFRKQVAVAADEIEKRGPFLLGDAFTGADILLGSCLDWALFYAEAIPEPLEEYRKRLHERPAFQSAFAANFPPEVMAQLAAQRKRAAEKRS